MGVGGQREAPAALLPAKSPGIYCGWGWVGPSAGVHGYAEMKIFFPEGVGGVYLIASCNTDWAVVAKM